MRTAVPLDEFLEARVDDDEGGRFLLAVGGALAAGEEELVAVVLADLCDELVPVAPYLALLLHSYDMIMVSDQT